LLRYAAVQGAQGHAACGWHERVRWEWVLGAVGRELLPMGLGRTDSLRGKEVAGGNAQPMSGRGMRGHFRSVHICKGYLARSSSNEVRPLN